MEVPPLMPASIGGGRDVSTVDAYEQFWDCWEEGIRDRDDVLPSEDVADAYHQYWQQAEL